MSKLRVGSARTVPGLVAKLSSSLSSVAAETYCSGMTETPKPGSARDCRPIYIGGSHRLALRNKAVAGGIAHQRHAALFPAKSRKGRSHLARFICPSIPEQKKPDRLCAS